MNINKLTLESSDYPEVLRSLERPPKQLYHLGAPLNDLLKRPVLAIIGSRGVTPYGERVTRDLARQAAEQGIVIVSGLALGADAIAHQAAITVGGLCVGVLPSPLDNVLPATNRDLARQIVEQGGALISEYASGDIAYKQNFVARNRLMSGLARAILVTEAAQKSGAKHTARFALDQGRAVLAVPGSIYNNLSAGTNQLIKQGATPVTGISDILIALNLERHATNARHVRGGNAYEQRVLDLMLQGITEGNELQEGSQLTAPEFAQVLTMLELNGKIRPLGANHWAIT